MGLSEELARYIKQTSYEDLPEEVVAFTKLCILDYFSSAFAGANKAPVQMIAEMIREMGGEEQATLVTGGKNSVVNAAFVNGAASHIVELDDIHKASIIHAATVVIPAAFAVAEWKQLSGKDLITAVVVGYEVCYRIGEAVSPSHYYYWHNTATCGTFGSTAAASKLLQLTEEQITHALGNAGSQAAGLWEFIEDGANTKQLHTGKAAMNGVISSLLAEKGFTGAQNILEGERGFFRAMTEDYDVAKITDFLGTTFKIMENSFKIHASCRHTHHAMDMMMDLSKERHLQGRDIDCITVKTYQVALNITNNDNPSTIYASKFSLQYCTALALFTGKGGLDCFHEHALWDEEIRQVMKKVKVEVDPEMDKAYPEKWGAKVEVKLTNGEVITKQADFPKGDPENPVTQNDLVEKFMELVSDIPQSKRQSLATNLLSIEKLESVDELFEVEALNH
ncbi:MmgE/PrpD family protein [Salirhabdus sp. Marseille-P4669]|uniref:MmgE/PrpD family protein n=1 Tax=Salirhabdus sp. Marseille-P4669 TaxID=2042310 RepID=UPI000C7E09CA|nr:MmgE/PrpD family protein [Salirhabdus sp. Marseille-P4669]